ncbi:MAG: prolipoprotein diacylglyceryl transferase [Clostridia bacterium]|nr:prolipoprotein diacylglyceryl transferase [Clostridia bacterium]
MTGSTIVILSVGTLLMAITVIVGLKRYCLPVWKCVPISLALLVVGTLGTYLLFWLENQRFGGRSFYGAVFLVPIVLLPFARIVRISYADLMDVSAPAGYMMLILMKIGCLMNGCCEGRILFFSNDMIPIRFPSQWVELIVAAILYVTLMTMEFLKKQRGNLYAWFLILYGCTRFVLNIFRAEWVTTDMLLPFGNIWSICAVIFGVMALRIRHYRELRNAPTK